MTSEAPLIQVPPGLKGVAVTDTAIGDVRGREGFYHYRQYSAVDLARHRSFEDVWYLFVEGHLPDDAQRRAFAGDVAPLRVVPSSVVPALAPIAGVGAQGPLDGLRSALSVLAAAHKMRPVLDIDAAERRLDALTLAAATPTLVAALHQLQRGRDPIDPRPDLGTAANLLWMIGDTELDPGRVRALEQYLIATIDHGFNASTFTARVIASTGADVGACVVGAVGALSGPLHGGAPSRALDLLDEIGTIDRIDAVVGPKLESGERIMGFGHAVYQGEDPRSELLRQVARDQAGSPCRVGRGRRAPGDRAAGAALPRARSAHQRGVLRRGGHGDLRPAGQPVHRRLRHQPHRGLGRARARAGRRSPHPAPERPLHRPRGPAGPAGHLTARPIIWLWRGFKPLEGRESTPKRAEPNGGSARR